MKKQSENIVIKLRDLADKIEIFALQNLNDNGFYHRLEMPERARIKRDGLNLRKDLIEFEKKMYSNRYDSWFNMHRDI